MKVLFEFNDRKFVMEAEQAGAIVNMIHDCGCEVYEHKTNWSTKEETHHVYKLAPAEVGLVRFELMSEELYGLGKMRGKPEA